MKRYVIFVLIGPAVGGLILLATTTYLSGYWVDTDLAEVGKFLVVLFSTLQFSYLFGLLPCLAIASIDDILAHVNRINGVADGDHWRDRLCGDGISLRLARPGQWCSAVRSLRPGRSCAGDAVVVACARYHDALSSKRPERSSVIEL
jgi:hypothetical protein